MTPDDLYKTILRAITRVRDTRASTITDLTAEPLSATDAVLDDMARNAAQNIVLMLDEALIDEAPARDPNNVCGYSGEQNCQCKECMRDD